MTLPDDADRVPGVADNLGTLVLVQLLGNVDGDVRKLEKGALGRDATAVQGLPPDLPGLLPRVPAKADGCEVECLVGNAAEDVHAALVLFGLVVARKVVRLRILTLESRTMCVSDALTSKLTGGKRRRGPYHAWVVICCPGRLHAAERNSLDVREKTALAD